MTYTRDGFATRFKETENLGNLLGNNYFCSSILCH